MSFYLPIVLSVVAAIIAVRWNYFKILSIAKEKRIVDNPNARKLQKNPVPILGGIAAFFGVVTGVLTGSSVSWIFSGYPLFSLAPVLCAMVIMVYVGAADDILGLSPTSRFLIEILTILGIVYASGGCIDSFHGLWGVESYSWWFAVPLTVLTGVGIINSINMIDGVNGLSSGLSIMYCCLFGVIFSMAGELPNAMLSFTMAASLIPFLLHNVFGERSRMFIGDAGTMMLGVLLSWFTISLLRSDTSVRLIAIQKNIDMFAMVLAFMSVPVFDTVRVMTLRILNKKSPFHPDKTHLHHIFIRMGVSHSITSLIEICINLLIVLIWAMCAKFHCSLNVQFYVVVVAGMLLVWGSFFFLRYHENRHTEFMHSLARFSIKTHLGSKAWWLRLQNRLDEPEGEHKEIKMTTMPVSSVYAFYHFDEIDPGDFKEVDRRKLFDFLKGRAEVLMEDIRQNSGADPLRVDNLVREGIRDGFIVIVKENPWDGPEIVSLTEEM